VLGDGGGREVVVEVGQPHGGQGTAPVRRPGGCTPRKACLVAVR
jgi:hypothetical protein